MFLPVIFLFTEVLVKFGILSMMVLALPLHLEGIWVFNVVIRVTGVTVTVVSTFVLIVPLRLVVAVQIMGFVVISVPSLLLFVVILARCMRLFMVSKLLLVLMQVMLFVAMLTILLVWLVMLVVRAIRVAQMPTG